jgi:hypothetical protein
MHTHTDSTLSTRIRYTIRSVKDSVGALVAIPNALLVIVNVAMAIGPYARVGRKAQSMVGIRTRFKTNANTDRNDVIVNS